MRTPTPDIRGIAFPLRLGEWTLAAPIRRLVVRNSGLLAGPVEEASHREEDLPVEADGYMLVQPARNGLEKGEGAEREENGLIPWVLRRGPRYFVRLEGSFDDYLARFSGKSRSNLRRKGRRLERESGEKAHFLAYRQGGFGDFYVAAREVSKHTYQEIMFGAGLPEDPVSAEAMRHQMDSGEAVGYMLFLGDVPVAYLYCPCREGIYEYQYVGFRPDYGHLSPGTVLLLRALEDVFNDPKAVAFDFTEGGGEESHKAYFATDSVIFETRVLLRQTFPNYGLIAARYSMDNISGGAGAVLSFLGVKKTIRHLMRRLAGS